MIKKRSCDRPLFYLNEKSYRIFLFSYPGKENKNYIPYLCEDIIEHRPPMEANGNIDLSTACYGEVKQNAYSLAILPWGATEPHNQHLPYLTDPTKSGVWFYLLYLWARKIRDNGICHFASIPVTKPKKPF